MASTTEETKSVVDADDSGTISEKTEPEAVAEEEVKQPENTEVPTDVEEKPAAEATVNSAENGDDSKTGIAPTVGVDDSKAAAVLNGNVDDCTKEESGAQAEEGVGENVAVEDPNSWRPISDGKTDLVTSTAEPDGDDDVMLDECDEGDEAGVEAAPPVTPKKKREYKRRVVRIPKEVFDYMARIEEDGVVRINVTQLGAFYGNEMRSKCVHVDASSWDTTDIIPLMDVGVPPTAKLNPTLIVDHFDNEPSIREAQETRLKSILENRERIEQMDEEPQSTVSKILPAEDQGEKKLSKKQRRREKREEMKRQRKDEKIGDRPLPSTEESKDNNDGKGMSILELRQKRLAERSVSSSTLESGTAAKQPRLDVNQPTAAKPSNASKTFPKKTGGPQSGKGAQNGGPPKTVARMMSLVPNAFNTKNAQAKNMGSPFKRPRTPPYAPPGNGSEWQNGPTPFHNDGLTRKERYQQKKRLQQEGRFNEIPSLFGRNGPGDVSPWSRPPSHQEDLHKLEEVMRRAAQENASSFEAARQVERLGLGSAMGAMLNAVGSREPSMSSSVGLSYSSTSNVPLRPLIPPHERGFNRAREDVFGSSRYGEPGFNMERSAPPIRDISRFIEPLDEFNDSPRHSSNASFSRVERITYPSMGGPPSGGSGGNSNIPPFGQSYSAFPNQGYGQRMEFGMGGSAGSHRPIENRRFYR